MLNEGLYRRIYDLELKDQDEALGELLPESSVDGLRQPRSLPAAGGGS
jgi:hypothetical protein